MEYSAKCVCVGCGYVATLHTRRDVINFWMKHFQECEDGISIRRIDVVRPVDVPFVDEAI